MRKVVAAEFLTLDGVMEAPGSADTTLPERRGWSEPYMNDEVGKVIFDQIQASDALLLGRKTYQDFAAFWPSVPDEYQLMVCPVILGAGKRLFDGDSDMKSLRLVDTKQFNSGMLLLIYRTEK